MAVTSKGVLRKLAKAMPKSARYAADNGWELDVSGKRHHRLVKGHHVVTVAVTPSDYRSDNNTFSRLRRIDRSMQ